MSPRSLNLDYEISDQAIAFSQHILSILEPGDKVVIFPHVRADGDSCGSALALSLMLEKLGYEPIVFLEEELEGENLIFPLGPYAETLNPADPVPQRIEGAKLAWMIDASEYARLGARSAAWETIPEHAVTDHHMSDWENAPNCWIDSEEPAVASLIFDLALLWEEATREVIFDLPVAIALYAALLTDTGRFTYAKVSERTFLQAAKLKSLGVDQELLTEHFFETMRYPRLLAHAEIARRLEFSSDKRVALTVLDKEFQVKSGATPSDFAGLCSWLRQLDGVDLAILLNEREDGWKVSLRSNCHADAQGLAKSFGGGGHTQAAGFNLDPGPADEIIQAVLARAGAYLR